MIRWGDAYRRLVKSKEFIRYFGQGELMPAYAFRPLTFGQRFVFAAGAATSPATNQNFPAGAIILGITSAGFLPQEAAAGSALYAPSFSWGRRDLYAINMQYTNDELITPGGPIMADALLGPGLGTIFPQRELLIAPSQGILCTVQNFTPLAAADPNQFRVDVAYHTMVPRAVG